MWNYLRPGKWVTGQGVVNRTVKDRLDMHDESYKQILDKLVEHERRIHGLEEQVLSLEVLILTEE